MPILNLSTYSIFWKYDKLQYSTDFSPALTEWLVTCPCLYLYSVDCITVRSVLRDIHTLYSRLCVSTHHYHISLLLSILHHRYQHHSNHLSHLTNLSHLAQQSAHLSIRTQPYLTQLSYLAVHWCIPLVYTTPNFSTLHIKACNCFSYRRVHCLHFFSLLREKVITLLLFLIVIIAKAHSVEQ